MLQMVRVVFVGNRDTASLDVVNDKGTAAFRTLVDFLVNSYENEAIPRRKVKRVSGTAHFEDGTSSMFCMERDEKGKWVIRWV